MNVERLQGLPDSVIQFNENWLNAPPTIDVTYFSSPAEVKGRLALINADLREKYEVRPLTKDRQCFGVTRGLVIPEFEPKIETLMTTGGNVFAVPEFHPLALLTHAGLSDSGENMVFFSVPIIVVLKPHPSWLEVGSLVVVDHPHDDEKPELMSLISTPQPPTSYKIDGDLFPLAAQGFDPKRILYLYKESAKVPQITGLVVRIGKP